MNWCMTARIFDLVFDGRVDSIIEKLTKRFILGDIFCYVIIQIAFVNVLGGMSLFIELQFYYCLLYAASSLYIDTTIYVHSIAQIRSITVPFHSFVVAIFNHAPFL